MRIHPAHIPGPRLHAADAGDPAVDLPHVHRKPGR
jgi:hypothetical protein